MKKAQSISINTIVVAAIALIVMILVIMIFTGSFSGFGKKSQSCIANGGTCKARQSTLVDSTGAMKECDSASETLGRCDPCGDNSRHIPNQCYKDAANTVQSGDICCIGV